MNKNTVIGITLIGLLLIGFSVFNAESTGLDSCRKGI